MKSPSSLLSIGLVAAQFLLIALLLSPVRTLIPTSLWDVPGSVCLIACVALVVWAFVSMRLRNFAFRPEPRDGTPLITHGPYAWIRHPMYTAVLLGGIGAVLTRWTISDTVLCAVLVVVMLTKLRREESLLLAHHADYAAYRKHSAALLPGIY